MMLCKSEMRHWQACRGAVGVQRNRCCIAVRGELRNIAAPKRLRMPYLAACGAQKSKMKIFLLHGDGNKTPDTPFYTTQVLTDTALLGKKAPFFIPDFSNQTTVSLHWAVRISRLGKGVNRRFAHRYYDAAGVALHFTAHPLLENLQAQGLPWDLATGFDGAVALGDFQPYVHENHATPACLAPAVLTIDHAERAALPALRPGEVADEALEMLSRFYTLRQGDVLLLPGTPAVEVHMDERLAVMQENACRLTFRVK